MIAESDPIAARCAIRAARVDDVGSVRLLAQRAFAPFVATIGKPPAPMVADFSAHQDKGELFVAELGGKLRGYIVLLLRADELFVENMAVDPDCRRQGLARQLLAFAHGMAAKHGRQKLRLYTNIVMLDAIKLYQRCGWREIERRHEDGFERVYFEAATEADFENGRKTE